MALKGPVQGGSEEVVSQAGGAHFRLGIAVHKIRKRVNESNLGSM